MSVSKAWYITCDNCGDPAEVSTESAADARQVAKSNGFVRKGVLTGDLTRKGTPEKRLADLCMVCRDKPELDGLRGEWTKELGIEAIDRGIRAYS